MRLFDLLPIELRQNFRLQHTGIPDKALIKFCAAYLFDEERFAREALKEVQKEYEAAHLRYLAFMAGKLDSI